MERKVNGNHRVSVRVRYSEVDRMGLLYHVTYLEYFELARSAWVRNFYRPYIEIEDEGFALVVIEAKLGYHKSAYYDDELEVEIKPSDWGRSRLAFEYAIFRKGEATPLCTGRTSHCFIGKNGRVSRIPDDLKKKLDEIKCEHDSVVDNEIK